MDRSSTALEFDGSSSSTLENINQFNHDIVQIRKLSIQHIEREVQDLQNSMGHGIDDVMSQLLNEKDDLKRDIEMTRMSIKQAAGEDIDRLQNRYKKQSKTLSDQKELLNSQHDDQEIEEIISLLNSNLRSIKGNITTRSTEMQALLQETERRYTAEKTNIEFRAAEYRVAIQDEVHQHIAELQSRLEQERSVLRMEEACCSYDNDNKNNNNKSRSNINSNSNGNSNDNNNTNNKNNTPCNSSPLSRRRRAPLTLTVDTSMTSLTPLTEERDSEREKEEEEEVEEEVEEEDSIMSPLVGNRLQFIGVINHNNNNKNNKIDNNSENSHDNNNNIGDQNDNIILCKSSPRIPPESGYSESDSEDSD